jgi:hypothetical protein
MRASILLPLVMLGKRRLRMTHIHGVRCTAAVGAGHPTAASGRCNSVWRQSAGIGGSCEPNQFYNPGRSARRTKAARPLYYGSYYAPGYGGFSSPSYQRLTTENESYYCNR